MPDAARPSVVLTVRTVGEGTTVTVDVPADVPVEFGSCDSGCCPATDLDVDGAAGSIVADERTWSIANLSASVPLRVWNLERPIDQVRVEPGTVLAPPFDLAGIAGASGHVLDVFGPDQRPAWSPRCSSGCVPAWGLDPASRRHAVMVALVSPRMTGDVTAPLPTTLEIAEMLDISPRTVEEHLVQLARVLRLSPVTARGPGWIREALAHHALERPYVAPPGHDLPW
ncbi:hypothetical protein [Isoptericola rhizosphaerae]|uniref:hypothetical protein n=1 Tax=Isoptericola rhizosphaerae TaxID=3377837 RepID=UPI00383A977C